MLLNELSHRVKNTLATVQSIAMQTMQSAPTMEAFQDAFEARLDAVAKTHNLLMQNPSQVVTLHDLVAGELSHYAADDGSRYAIEGDGVWLESNRAVPIEIIFPRTRHQRREIRRALDPIGPGQGVVDR